VELELAHALCDLSEYLEALDALSRADSFTPVTNEGAAAFHEMIGFRRGVCLGDSGKLEEAAFAYLSTVESAMRSRRVSRISVAALGYAAMVLGYLQQPAAQPLGALSVQFAERLGNPSLLARNRCSYAQLLSYLGAVDDANELVRIAETSIRSVPAIQQDRRELGRVLIAKASTSLAMDDLTGARNAVGEAFAINTQLGDRRRMARTEAFAGVIEMREGNQDESSRILMKSLNALVDVGDMLNVLLCCFTLAFADGFQSADEAIEHGAANGSVQHPYGWGEILKDCMRSGYPVRSIASFWDTCYRTRILGLH